MSNAAFGGCCVLATSLIAVSATYQGMPDPDHYRRYAEQYAAAFFDGAGAPDAYRPPFYPMLLVPVIRFAAMPEVWIAALHACLTLALLNAVWRLALHAGGTHRMAIVACLLVAIDPILVFQSGQIMTETIFTAFVLWTLLPWLADDPKSNGAAAWNGLLVGAGCLIRPTMAPLFLAVAVALAARQRWLDLRAWLLAGAAAVCVVLPWAVHNKRVLGEFVFTTTHGGYTLWLANNESFYKYEVVGGRNWAGSKEFEGWRQANDERTQGLDELQKDRLFRTAALRWMCENPGHSIRAAVYRLSALWAIQPRTGPQGLRPLVGAYYATFLLMALHGWLLTSSWRGPWLGATLVVVAVSTLHTIYWSNMRFRAPIEPILAVWAARSVEWFWRRTAA